MKKVKDSPFKLDQFIVVDFRIKRNPLKVGDIDLNIKPSGIFDRNKKVFTLQLGVDVLDSNKAFDIKLNAIGVFKFKGKLPEQDLPNYFYLNAPAIMFPYIRAYISTVTALSGLNAVNLPVLNLTELQDELKSNTTFKED